MLRVNVARAMSHKLGSSKAVWSADSWFQESLTEEGVGKASPAAPPPGYHQDHTLPGLTAYWPPHPSLEGVDARAASYLQSLASSAARCLRFSLRTALANFHRYIGFRSALSNNAWNVSNSTPFLRTNSLACAGNDAQVRRT